ncbi:MAG: hypothetical protein KDD70_00760 [Bdellovibrionales bacterium]|nr:hypothetical protein [Bdellovibrionales bacterium]
MSRKSPQSIGNKKVSKGNISNGSNNTAREGEVLAAEGEGRSGGAPLSVSGEAIQQTMAEDPLAKFVQRRWRELAITVAVVFLVIYVKDAFEQTRMASLRRSADLLIDLQAQVEQLKGIADQLAVKKDEEKKKEVTEAQEATGATESSGAQAKEASKTGENESAAEGEAIVKAEGEEQKEPELSEDEKRFATSMSKARELTHALAQERSPYAELSSFYGRVLDDLNPEASASTRAATVSVADVDQSLQRGILGEVEAFQAALSLANSNETLPQAVKGLEDIIEKSTFSGTAALSVLYSISQYEEGEKPLIEEARVKELMGGYLERNPHQAAVLRKEVPQLF